MFVVDGIAYAGEQPPVIKVKSVRPLDGYKLWIRFSTGEEKEFDFSPLLTAPCFKALEDKAIFNSVYIDYGIPVWNDGEIDIAPERLYQDGMTIGVVNA